MQIKVKINNETISDGNLDYGVGGAFPAMGPIVVSQGLSAVACHLFHEIEDNDEAIEKHSMTASSPIEKNQRLEDGDYPVTILADGQKIEATVSLSW